MTGPVPTSLLPSACRGGASAGYEAVEGAGPVLKAFEPVVDEGFEAVEGNDWADCA